MHVTFTNPLTGEQKSVKSGFSSVLFLFTPFYGIPLFIRGLHLHGAIVAMVGIVALFSPGYSALVPLSGLLLLASMVFYGIKGNELTMANLQQRGWQRSDQNATPVSSDQTAPPGSAAPQGNKLVKGLGIAAAVVVGLIVIGAIVGPGNGSSPMATEDTSKDDTAAAAPVEVSAAQLFRDYEANEQAAQLKYGSQPVLVSGHIASIELDALDEPMVSLQAGDMLEEVTLHFGSDFANTAATLRKGEWFVARCGSVSELIGAPQLNDCTMEMEGDGV